MATSYASDWPVLPGIEPRPVTRIQWPSPPRVEVYRTSQTTAQLSIELPIELPAQLPAQPPAQQPAQLPLQLPIPLAPVMLVMSLPPEARYNSFEALYEAAQLHALLRGYAFTKRCSKKTN